MVLGARTASQLEAVAREADPSGKRVATVPTDITEPEACAAIVSEAERRFGQGLRDDPRSNSVMDSMTPRS